MSNILDYIGWRGDLSFGNAPLCPPDALIFSVLAYVDLTGAVPRDPREEPVRLSEAAARYFEEDRAPTAHDALLRTMAASTRFGSLRLLGAVRQTDKEHGVQFGAVSVLLPGGGLFAAFEGTDDSLVGWKEDFRMCYECPVPAQRMAARYFEAVAAAYPLRRLYLGGHSKGGNLAMYAAVCAGPAAKERIKTVYNNDGPGFCDGTIYSPAFAAVRDRVRTYLPASSFVAVLLEHDQKHDVVAGTGRGIFQHDPYAWQIQGKSFVPAERRTAFGERTEAILDEFLTTLRPARRRQFCEALFTVLEGSEQETISGINKNKRESMRNIVRAYGALPPDMRQVLADTVAALQRAARTVDRRKEKKRAAMPASEETTDEG